jgi:hypothetical protein
MAAAIKLFLCCGNSTFSPLLGERPSSGATMLK